MTTSGRYSPESARAKPNSVLRENDNDFLALSSNVPISAAQTIYAMYAETAFPFVTRENRKPFVEALELTLAGRFEHFSIHGQTTKPKASLVWKPASWLKLRGSAAESFRAPNLVQTNITPLRRQISANDPYRGEVTGLAADGTAQRTVFRQGNEQLQPEEAKTWVAGLVLDVPKVRGLSFAFDYFRLNQNSVIEYIGAPGTLRRDELLLDLATQAALAAGTAVDQIDLGSGTAASKGYRAVTRVRRADRRMPRTTPARRAMPPGARWASSRATTTTSTPAADIEGYGRAQWRGPRRGWGSSRSAVRRPTTCGASRRANPLAVLDEPTATAA